MENDAEKIETQPEPKSEPSPTHGPQCGQITHMTILRRAENGAPVAILKTYRGWNKVQAVKMATREDLLAAVGYLAAGMGLRSVPEPRGFWRRMFCKITGRVK